MTFLRVAWLGARPKTLLTAVAPIYLAYLIHQQGHLAMILPCLGVGVFIQISTNYFNDYYDGLKGADEKRFGPERFGSNPLAQRWLFSLAMAFVMLAFLCALPLFKLHWGYLALAPLCLFFAYGYTGGPYPLAYHGLGELFVFIFFGPVATLGSSFALSGELSQESFTTSFALGLYATLLIAMNNLRDRITDKDVGKNTLAVLWGERNFKIFITALLIILFTLEALLVSGITLVPVALVKIIFLLALWRARRPESYAKIFPVALVHIAFFLIYQSWWHL